MTQTTRKDAWNGLLAQMDIDLPKMIDDPDLIIDEVDAWKLACLMDITTSFRIIADRLTVAFPDRAVEYPDHD